MDAVSPAPDLVLGVCGHPLAQSLSPLLHTWALARNAVSGRYSAWDTPPEALAGFMRAFREEPRHGASVTIPHKEAVMPFLDGMTETARSIGAVNTLFRDGDRLLGHNTDMEGFLAPLKDLPAPGTALVLGAGGAARAVLAGLASLAVPLAIIAARTKEKAEALIRDFGPSFASLTFLPWDACRAATPGLFRNRDGAHGLWVVNTTPLGMRGKAEGESPLPAGLFQAQAGTHGPENFLAYDLVYNPLETAFLSLAANAGWQCRDGLDMFVGQGAAQFRLWTGRDMDMPEARALLTAHLARTGTRTGTQTRAQTGAGLKQKTGGDSPLPTRDAG